MSNAKGSRLPEDWKPTMEARKFARDKHFTEAEIDDQADRFRDYWIGVAGKAGVKLDWLATWRNHIRTQADRRQRPAFNHSPSRPPPRRFQAPAVGSPEAAAYAKKWGIDQ